MAKVGSEQNIIDPVDPIIGRHISIFCQIVFRDDQEIEDEDEGEKFHALIKYKFSVIGLVPGGNQGYHRYLFPDFWKFFSPACKSTKPKQCFEP